MPVEMMPGLIRRTLAVGERVMMIEVTADEGVYLPMHSHHHEQVGYVISGRIEFELEGETFIANPGDSYALPGRIEHAARFLAPTKVLETFSPPREEYR
ncbi:MAG: cupin domain-containing protein [Proteobacteria bacterium]|nr:cupin domain-containing protein [Pseudomonadota bacterium]